MTTAIILSGGTGTRMGKCIPKQYLEFAHKPILIYSLITFNLHPLIDKIIIVADKQWHEKIDKWILDENINKFSGYAVPGETRQFSIINALEKIQASGGANNIIIHDAARPLVSAELITSCLTSLHNHDGVMPVLFAKDTFYLLDEHGMASKLLPRSCLVAGQAPEAFNFEKYYAANKSLSYKEITKINGSSELALKCGIEVATVPGDEKNIKITTPNDLILLEKYIK